MTVLDRDSTYRVAQERPLPLDACLQDGVSIWYDLQPLHVSNVLERVDFVLDRMQADRTRQFGACVAYAIGLQPQDIRCVDSILFESLDSRVVAGLAPDHTIATQCMESWRGEIGDTRFYLHKFTGSIALTNNEILPARVYSVAGSSLSGRY